MECQSDMVDEQRRGMRRLLERHAQRHGKAVHDSVGRTEGWLAKGLRVVHVEAVGQFVKRLARHMKPNQVEGVMELGSRVLAKVEQER